MSNAVTLAVMVRDDARRLDRCLSSLSRHVDEILVVDTGSVDDTVAVAKARGARVVEIEWPDDFSTALNTMLGLVRTPWTLRLDSDEWFEEGQASSIRSHLAAAEAAGYYLIRRDLMPTGRFDEIYVLRLWRTHELVRYEGVVHEVIRHAVFEAAFPDKKLIRSDIFLWHDGYVDDIGPKAERNVKLLQIEAERHPDKLDVQAMLATTLRGMGDPRGQALLEAFADRVLKERPESVPTQGSLALAMYMDSLSIEQAKEDRTAELIALAVNWFPKNPVVLYFAGVLERKRDDFERSLDDFLRIEALIEADDYDRGISIPSELVGERLWRSMAFVASKLGRQDVVSRCQRRLGRTR